MTLTKIFESILVGYLSNKQFEQEVVRIGSDIVSLTIDIYERILKEKLPIPSKFHYTFNLRDVSKVIQGILMTAKETIRTQEQMHRLWVHEVQRVFYDRLVNEDDRLWFEGMVIELLVRTFRVRLERKDIFGENKILFGDLLKLDPGVRHVYEEIKDSPKLNKVLKDRLEDYNAENTNKMELVFFDYAIDHLLRIARVLRQPRGNIMLIGVGGSGKQSLVRLASYMLEF